MFKMLLGGNFKLQDLAKREKELGNECYKSDDFEEALRHYNTSIEIYPTIEAKNNRAMSCKHNYHFILDFQICYYYSLLY